MRSLRRILIVEDKPKEDAVAKAVIEYFEKKFDKVVTCASYKEIPISELRSFDLLILDILMGHSDKDYNDFVQANRDVLREVPFALMTAVGKPWDIKRALNEIGLAPIGYILKRGQDEGKMEQQSQLGMNPEEQCEDLVKRWRDHYAEQ